MKSKRVPPTKPPEAFVEYWERTVPWTFKDEGVTYEERRRMRYGLQDYMLDSIPFGSYSGKRVLEIGSGGGIDSAEFGRNGADVVCLDFTRKGSKSTKETLSEARVSSWNVVRAAAQSLPFRDGVFDCVYSFGVLHHIQAVGQVMREILRGLRRGGDLVLMLYNRDSLLYAYSILHLHREAGLSEGALLNRYSERVEGCPFTKAYSKEDVRALLADDFLGVSTEVHYNVIDTPKKRKVKTGMPDELGLGWHIIVKAKKSEAPVRMTRATSKAP